MLDEQTQIYSVSRLNHEVRWLLESQFANIWLEGEVASCALPRSGHCYFTLKDQEANIRCAFFNATRRGVQDIIVEGQSVLARGKLSLYPNRGDYQLIVEHVEPQGVGALQRAFEALKKRLHTEGLFDQQHKQAIPTHVQRLGVITSPTGAAVRDIISVLKRRNPNIEIVIYPCLVQGANAAQSIVEAIHLANHHNYCDVLLLSRGGGSLEDLWCFNEEPVARAIFISTLPLISGVGHEIDTTIADLVADQRAATPSAAAEQLSTPELADYLQTLTHYFDRLIRTTQNLIRDQQQHIDRLALQLKHPKIQLQEQYLRLQHCQHTLQLSWQHCLLRYQARLQQVAERLQTLSPLATLARGYALATDQHGTILKQASQAQLGDPITVQLGQGTLACSVDRIITQGEDL